MELPPSTGEPSISVLACVVHSQPEGDAEWVLGCRFSAELNDADLAAFGAVRSKPDGLRRPQLVALSLRD